MGNGHLAEGRFNLILSLRHNASTKRVAEWRASFERASELIFDATDGQHEFGTIFVCNNSSGGRNADAWLLEPDGRSSASVGALGTETAHMTLYGDERFKPFIVVHEFGHYAYGVRDEYVGPAGPAECVGGTTSDACIMESAWSDGDRFGAAATGGTLVQGRVSEFCTSSNHDPDGDTRQQDVNARSCWETMVETFPSLAEPAGVPSAPAPGGSTAIEWVLLLSEQRFVLIVDRSGSMAGMKLREAQFGSDWWADNAQLGDRLGLVSFANSATADFPLTPVAGDADRTDAQAAVAGLVAGGQTSIGGGLREAFDMIRGAGERAATQVAVLLTDGEHNSGEDPLGVIPDLVEIGVRVYTIGIGVSVNTTLLQDIATRTGGAFHRIDPSLPQDQQEFRIRTVLQEISGVARDNGGVVTFQPEALPEPEQSIERSAFIESNSEFATFGITWQAPDSIVDLELVSPEGEVVAVDALPANVRQIRGRLPYMAFQVERPAGGEWRVRILPRRVKGGTESQLFVFSQQPRIDGALYVPRRGYEPGDTVPLFLQVYFDQPVTGLAVSGIAHLPGGEVAPLRFDDNGDSTFGDEVAKDGLYSALFDETHGEAGTYLFEVQVESDGVSAEYPVEGEKVLPGETFVRDPIPAFRRVFTYSIVVGREHIEPIKEDER